MQSVLRVYERCAIQCCPFAAYSTKRVLPPSMRELRKDVSNVLTHMTCASIAELHRPMTPVSMYCEPVDSTYWTKWSGWSFTMSTGPAARVPAAGVNIRFETAS